MSFPRKQKPRRKPFVVTVAQAATAVVLLPGCITTVTSNPPPTESENPPPVETPECPATPPDTNTPCTEPLSCEYNNACVEVYYCEEGTWHMTSGCNPPPVDPCPPEAPASGALCSYVTTCSYTVDYGCGPQEQTASCDGAVWTTEGISTCNPPPPDDCVSYKNETECAADAGCRWLVPGCGMPALPEAGCFAVTNCTGDFDCPISGGTCQEVSIDPCHNQPCDACSMTVSVCMTPAAP
ncbi:hypothetical protein [Polyangium fumosum]|uniref:Chitin-binding type-2 domain-containing protein n=1 Tax=Polyangium fumosum TaxID=889272 RepID=A0A4U1J089_9BACT|nr:hypothetical protein [Polyangium fumosum]TKD00298.1 hypothetical protein E8A74_34915 [Polyangium fumosum]